MNAIAEFPLDYHLVPYAGLGLGYRYIEAEQNHHEWAVYQVKAGINLAMTDRVKLFADYRLMNSFYKDECINHNVCGGVKVTF